MLLKEMINKYPEQYIAVAHVKKGVDNLIQTATVLKVYPTLRDAYSNINEIKLFMNRYADFDIVHGDYDLYISYKEPLETKVNSWGSVEYVNYDVCVCGNDIIDMVLAAEKYSGFDTTEVRAGIEEKRIWLRDHEPEYYKEYVGEDKDIFTLWKERGYIK